MTILAILSFVAVSACNRDSSQDNNMTNEQSSKSQSESDDGPHIIGQQMADAQQAETKWRNESVGQNSPLPETEYDFWSGELSLIRPTPNDLDQSIQKVCQQYAQADAKERSTIRHSISMKQFYTLMIFAKRSAVFGLREAKAVRITDALSAIAMIERERVDFRDITWCLSLLYHAAHQAGGDADEMFRTAAKLAEPDVAKTFENFLKQPPDYRSLRESWGYDEVQTEDGVGFIGWGFCDYNPSIDLKSTIIEISELVASDKYQPSSIEVATELPDVWVGGQEDPESKCVLSGIRAGATISASLHPDHHPKHDSQQFSVFLVETANAADAQTLSQMATQNQSPTHCHLAMANSNLFCLIVTRSFVQGVDAYETEESLTRFSKKLAAILERHAESETEK